MTPFPFRVARAAGAHLVDVDGFDYVDLLGDFTAGLLGHSPEPVAEAVRARLERGWSIGATHEDELRLAELITGRFPAIDQLRFTNSGTEATMMAVQLARHVTGRPGVVVADGGYHGGLLNFSGHGEPLQAPLPIRQVTHGDLAELEAALTEEPRPACVLLEWMLGAGGCLPPPDGYFDGVRELCDRHGVLFVLDEVMTSRMSVGGAQQRFGVRPDLTTLGKYLGGGLGFGAFGGRRRPDGGLRPAARRRGRCTAAPSTTTRSRWPPASRRSACSSRRSSTLSSTGARRCVASSPRSPRRRCAVHGDRRAAA